MYRILFTIQAAKDAKLLRTSGLDKKAKEHIDIIRLDPVQNPPRFEALVGKLSGLYSRRINLKHRLVYQVIHKPVDADGMTFEGTVKIVRMWTHY